MQSGDLERDIFMNPREIGYHRPTLTLLSLLIWLKHDSPTPRAQKPSKGHLCAGKDGGPYGSCRTLANSLRFHSFSGVCALMFAHTTRGYVLRATEGPNINQRTSRRSTQK